MPLGLVLIAIVVVRSQLGSITIIYGHLYKVLFFFSVIHLFDVKRTIKVTSMTFFDKYLVKGPK